MPFDGSMTKRQIRKKAVEALPAIRSQMDMQINEEVEYWVVASVNKQLTRRLPTFWAKAGITETPLARRLLVYWIASELSRASIAPSDIRQVIDMQFSQLSPITFKKMYREEVFVKGSADDILKAFKTFCDRLREADICLVSRA